ncbi:MAG TPA: fatty acyl-AMP ligase, partial [Ktedonobacteraceae bacterium]|nr:fatty acyl-AMP ligase [Ktedonobacteraceae bacterium]
HMSIPAQTVNASTLVELLCHKAAYWPDQHAYTFLRQGETEEGRLTYGELDRQARTIAALLQSKKAMAQPVLLLHQPGLAYITAFLGCLYAGAIAVPAYPPRSFRTMPRIQAIVTDTQARLVLTTADTLADLQRNFTLIPDLQHLEWIATDTLDSSLAAGWQAPAVTSESLAFLQYTSGSTATPRGVMVTHGNLLHNLGLMHRHCEQTHESHMVCWLPPYHDMGLIGGILFPLYEGFPSTLMSPLAFLQRPFRWLQAISRTGATISVAPNFAYDLCMRKTTPEQRAGLDLSRWELAANGAEPVREGTLRRFAATFASCGFHAEAMFPCYGLAEATLMVASGKLATPPVISTVQRWALEQNRVIEGQTEDADTWKLVGYDQVQPDERIAIVHPDTFKQCRPGQVGEIWIASPSVARGYWNRPQETESTFRAFLADTGEGPFLRTGDLGFFQDGYLYITGRQKELIIIRGRNYYPHDIELTTEQCHPAIRPGCCAAFSIDVNGKEQLVILAEIDARYLPSQQCGDTSRQDTTGMNRKYLDAEQLVKDIRWEIWEQHDLQPHAVMLVKAGSIAKTSSGKTQRGACQAAFLAGSLGAWHE